STCTPTSPVTTVAVDVGTLTTGTSEPLTGPTPCAAQAGEPTGVPPKPHACGGTACDAHCTGNACVSQIPDPDHTGQTTGVDAKGGLSERCCTNATTRPCFPLAGDGRLVRTGRAGVPLPPLPDPLYPKASDAVLAATFCLPAGGANVIDSVFGLPGPAAI